MQTTFVRNNPGNEAALTCEPKDLFPAANGNGEAVDNRAVLKALATSKLYHDYEQAFSEATGLAVALRPVESWQLPLQGKRHENRFCQMMSRKSAACAACLQVNEVFPNARAENPNHHLHGRTLRYRSAGQTGDRLIGFLQTGQVFRRKPTEAQFERTAKLVAEWGVDAEPAELEKAYFDTRVVSRQQHDSVVSC